MILLPPLTSKTRSISTNCDDSNECHLYSLHLTITMIMIMILCDLNFKRNISLYIILAMDRWLCGRLLLLALILLEISALTSGRLPNIIIILTDDQDVTLNGMLPMKNVNTLIAQKGATFENAVCIQK